MEKKRFSFPWKRVFNLQVVCLVLVVLAAGVTREYFENVRAHQVLREGKDLLLTLRMVGTEYYASGKLPVDMNRESRLRAAAEEEVRRISEAEGDFQVLEWNDDSYTVAAMEYRREDYVALYQQNQDGSYRWRVMRIKPLLEFTFGGTK